MDLQQISLGWPYKFFLCILSYLKLYSLLSSQLACLFFFFLFFLFFILMLFLVFFYIFLFLKHGSTHSFLPAQYSLYFKHNQIISTDFLSSFHQLFLNEFSHFEFYLSVYSYLFISFYIYNLSHQNY